jgi:hypothetical protein
MHYRVIGVKLGSESAEWMDGKTDLVFKVYMQIILVTEYSFNLLAFTFDLSRGLLSVLGFNLA